MQLAEVTYSIARTAAGMRAMTRLALPDAIVIATAIERGADVVATNDRQWPSSVEDPAGRAIPVLHLDAFVSP